MTLFYQAVLPFTQIYKCFSSNKFNLFYSQKPVVNRLKRLYDSLLFELCDLFRACSTLA